MMISSDITSVRNEANSLRSEINLIKSQPPIEQSIRLQTILENLGRFNETKDFRVITSLRALTADQIDQLRASQPVIFGPLPAKVLYEVILSNGPQNLYLIYDLDENKILRQFVFTQAAAQPTQQQPIQPVQVSQPTQPTQPTPTVTNTSK